ncbi:choice-of-anchor U domain-containing protein [Paraglaciecola sp.]|uniref:choice-of-anchor U domain-containing protein n=1 Tax=Paraglaciecola sp. TaxID=1920173 RepID=UPI003EF325B8
MSTKFKHTKIAAAILALAPVYTANAAAPVFVENSILDTEFQVLFEAAGDSSFGSLATDSAGNVYTSIQLPSNLVKVKSFADAAISDLGLQSVTPASVVRTGSRIRVDSNGNLLLAYLDGNEVKLKTSTDGGLTFNETASMTAPVDTIALVDLRMKLDSQNVPYIQFNDQNTRPESVLYRVENGRLTEVLNANIRGWAGNVSGGDWVIDSNDEIHFFWRGKGGLFGNNVAYIRTIDGVAQEAIQTDGLAFHTEFGISINSQDEIYFHGVRANHDLAGGAVSKLNGTTWERVGNQGFLFDNATDYSGERTQTFETDMYFDSNDVPYVSYINVNHGSAAQTSVQVFTLVNDVWTLIPYDITDFIGDADPTVAQASGMELHIDKFNRVLSVQKHSGTGITPSTTVMRLNLLSTGTETLQYNLTENVSFSQAPEDLMVKHIEVVDAENDAISYALSGTDADLFEINANGKLSFKSFGIANGSDTIYNLTVDATSNSETTSQPIEITLVNNPSNDGSDNEGDGYPDHLDDDDDNDGYADTEEAGAGSDPLDASDVPVDSDSDGMSNYAETSGLFGHITDPTKADSDDDGINDLVEINQGTLPTNADSDGDGLNDLVDFACPNTAGDCTAPQFPDEELSISFDASSNLMSITAQQVSVKVEALGIVITDVLDDDVSISSDHISFMDDKLASGLYSDKIELSHTDSEGFTINKYVTLNINPVVKLPTKLVVEPGQTQVEIPVIVLGDIPADTTTLNYIVMSGGTETEGSVLVTGPSEDNSGDLPVTIPQSVESIYIDISENAVHGDEITIKLDASEHVNVLNNTMTTLSVIAENQVPIARLYIEQESALGAADFLPVNRVITSGGYAKVTVMVDDVNMADMHDIAFTVSHDVLVDMPEGADVPDVEDMSNTFIFDPTLLDPLSYEFMVDVVENNTTEAYAASNSLMIPVDRTDSATLSIDSDMDGIADTEEVAGFEHDNSRFYIARGDIWGRVDNSTGNGAIVVSGGYTLKLGQFAEGKAQRNNDNELIVNSIARTPTLWPNEEGLISVNGEIDQKFKNPLNTVSNFIIDGLAQHGDSASVVIPLIKVSLKPTLEDPTKFENIISDVSIPEGAEYRKYTQTEGWFTFVEDDNNSIASAMKDEFGNCPVPGSTAYYSGNQENGLVEGNQCVQLTIEDGGVNDADGIANGKIEDPGFLATQDENRAPSLSPMLPVSGVSGEMVNIVAEGMDIDGDELTYTWQLLSVDPINVGDVSNPMLSFTAPTVSEATTYVFGVTATDESGLSSILEEVELTVTAPVTEKPAVEIERGGGSIGWLFSLFMVSTGLFRRYKAKK